MKLQALSAVVAAPLLIMGTMFANGYGLGTPEDPQDDLRALVDAQAKQISDLRIDLIETRDLVEMTLTYIDTQSKSAKSLEATLSSAEALGFTAGINPRSRETLLSGWRAYLADQQTAVPRQKVVEAPPTKKR